MRNLLVVVLLFTNPVFSQINFDQYFENKSLRLDYFHTGNSTEDNYSFDELIEEPFWGGSKTNLIDKFNYGKYKFIVKDYKTGQIIYSRTYSTLFSEWQTTDEAKQTVRTFNETIVFPYPKNSVVIEFYSRDRLNTLNKKFEYLVDPNNYFIKTERAFNFTSFEGLVDIGCGGYKLALLQMKCALMKTDLRLRHERERIRFRDRLHPFQPNDRC